MSGVDLQVHAAHPQCQTYIAHCDALSGVHWAGDARDGAGRVAQAVMRAER